jgi:hypothetical protein
MAPEGGYASRLRQEICERNRLYAAGRAHVESYGSDRVIVYAPQCASASEPERHGNFFDPAYSAICARPEWLRRLSKIHTGARNLPKAEKGALGEAARRWRELDSSTSSDALLMNVFCTPEATESAEVRRVLGVEALEAIDLPIFGWKARVPLNKARVRPTKRGSSERFDTTEVDMRWGNLLVEAKLTEADFQTRSAAIVEGYRDFDQVFDRELLPRAELRTARRRTAPEFAEEFTQEWEDSGGDDEAARQISAQFQAEIVARARLAEPAEPAYAGYQLIRNVLAAYANNCSFCVLHDQRRPDLREAWFRVMSAVKPAEMRVRCQVLTWQELAALLPNDLREFLAVKYGIA